MNCPNVVVRTWPVMLVIFAPVSLPLALVIFLGDVSMEFSAIEMMVAIAMVSIALTLIGLKFLSEVETARVEEDRIVFKYKKIILFSEIESFTYDNGFRIKMKSRFWSLLFHDLRNNGEGYCEFMYDLKLALSDYRERNLSSGVDMPKQKFFFGTWKAVALGVAFITLYAFFVDFLMDFGVMGYLQAAVFVPAVFKVSIFLFFGKKDE